MESWARPTGTKGTDGLRVRREHKHRPVKADDLSQDCPWIAWRLLGCPMSDDGCVGNRQSSRTANTHRPFSTVDFFFLSWDRRIVREAWCPIYHLKSMMMAVCVVYAAHACGARQDEDAGCGDAAQFFCFPNPVSLQQNASHTSITTFKSLLLMFPAVGWHRA